MIPQENTDSNRLSNLPYYIKEHKGLNGKTPAEACGIVIKGKNKWKTLIQNAGRKE